MHVTQNCDDLEWLSRLRSYLKTKQNSDMSLTQSGPNLNWKISHSLWLVHTDLSKKCVTATCSLNADIVCTHHFTYNAVHRAQCGVFRLLNLKQTCKESEMNTSDVVVILNLHWKPRKAYQCLSMVRDIFWQVSFVRTQFTKKLQDILLELIINSSPDCVLN